MTEAQKRASAKYRKACVTQIILRFYPADKKLYEFARDKGTPWIKELIRQEVK